ncbi:MAG TPA: protein kinase [Steroidobacteraceae bacterium]|nr:protein kinase [Steroidobacteraceae bacterium]
MPAWSSGQSIAGRYRLERPLGRGASAEAWSANDTVDDTRVLIKLPSGTDGAATVSFDREFDASRALDHPDVPRALAHGRDGEHPYLVTTCIEGRSLADRRGQPFAALAPLLAGLARTVAFVHEKGWVHRDLKPANVLVGGERRALLTDFGLAARIGERQPPNGGSPFTRSPGQAAGLPAEPADDLYSFGALLYELLSGHPPFYPDRAAADAPGRQVPPLEPAHPVPARMERLIAQLLEMDPMKRPESMHAVADELDKAMKDTQPSDGPRSHASVTLGWNATRTAAATPPDRPRAGRWWPWAAGLGFITAAFIVFVVLPDHAPSPVLAPTATTGEQPAAPLSPASAAAKAAAVRAQNDFDGRIAALEKRSAAVWGGPELAKARSFGLDGEGLLKSEQYADSLAAYTRAADQLTAVEAKAPLALQTALDNGARALDTARSGEATQDFNLALSIDPDNAAAKHGLKRAAAADRVQELIVQGRRAVSDKQWAAAVDAYRHALSLDGDATEARDGLAGAQRALNEELYQTAMAQALDGLKLRRFAAARSAIERAHQLRPQAVEPRDLAGRVNAAIAGTKIEDLREEAGAHERAERWSDALTVYVSILERNPTLLFARDGRDRVAPRVQLDTRLNDYIARPERLGSPEVREAATRSVAEARRVASAGPALRTQLTKVEALLARAATPVHVAIESDSATEVVIYHVGSLGAFARRELDLAPGTYTVIGMRTGFRDVRHELRVRPGESPAALVVRCEDRI